MNKISTDTAFLQMVEDHKKLIFKVANSYCKEEALRQDLIQEIVMELWRAFPKYDPTYKYSTWIYRISLNTAISFYRKEKKRPKARQELNEQIFNIPIQKEENRALQEKINLLYQFIDQLNEIDRALMLLYLDEKNHQEIAHILGISKTNVATKIGRIKVKLKNNFLNVNK